jgi:Zn-dependent peptidase ImmA (M78 family)/DNA-binding XRE family transcriptional regulator
MNLRELRELSGMNQEALGELAGVTRQTIAAWERGDREPSMQQVVKLCRILNVPIDVMLGMAETSEQALLFRSDAADTLSPAMRQLLTRKALDYGEIERFAGALPNLPGSRPMTTFDEHIVDQVANEVRDWLGVEDAPLGDVLSLLEGKGLKIFLHKLPNSVSGFSAYTDEIGGAIFVNADHRTERQYFTALHELSHLIFHRKEYQAPATTTPKVGKSDPREQAANYLAGAVLLPRTVMEAELHPYRNRWLPFSLLGDIKRRYSVSMRTILVRSGQLGIISTRQSFQQIAKIDNQFGKENEPYDLTPPQSLRRLNRLVYQTLIEEKITTSKAAEVLGEPVQIVKNELGKWLSEEIA